MGCYWQRFYRLHLNRFVIFSCCSLTLLFTIVAPTYILKLVYWRWDTRQQTYYIFEIIFLFEFIQEVCYTQQFGFKHYNQLWTFELAKFVWVKAVRKSSSFHFIFSNTLHLLISMDQCAILLAFHSVKRIATGFFWRIGVTFL